MSRPPISRSDDLRRLEEDGYNVSLRSGHVVLEDVPYVDAARRIRLGILACPANLDADGVTLPPHNHVMSFAGDYPCDHHGQPLEKIRHGSNRHELAPGLFVYHSFSSKPSTTGKYDDYHHKMTTYAWILASHAQAIDPTATPQVFRTSQGDDDGSPFNYVDTASSRAGIAAAAHKLATNRVAIIGLGGTGSYIFDLVTKTPVREIHPFDGDHLGVHNAFRAPGAASVEELREVPFKVDYFAARYAPMRRGIVPHRIWIDATNVHELDQMNFVFICMDAGEAKQAIIEHLEQTGISFIDVGMGLQLDIHGQIGGTLRVTASTPTKRDHIRAKSRISFGPGAAQDVYRDNIQVADLNALNAALAVIKWKKLLGFYRDLEREHFSAYEVDGNSMINEDQP